MKNATKTIKHINVALAASRQLVKISAAGVVAATDSRQLLDSRVHSFLVVTYARVRHTRVGRTLEYATPG